MLLASLCATAQQWDWVQRFQGDASGASTVALDGSGNVYVAGSFSGTNQIGTNQLVSSGSNDVFIAKLSGDGEVIWATATGDPDDDSIRTLLVTTNGTAFLLGSFYIHPSLLTETNADTSTTSSNVLVIARIDDGKFSWFHTFPPEVFNRAADAALGPDESLWMIGASNRVFINRYRQDGAFSNSLFTGNTAFTPLEIAIGRDEQLFVSGSFGGNVDLGGTNLTKPLPDFAKFTAGINGSGSARWAWMLHESYSAITDLVVAPDGTVITVGYWDTGLPQGYALIVRHSADGTTLWRRDIGGNWKTIYQANGVAMDSRGIIHLAGSALEAFADSYAYRLGAMWLLTMTANGSTLTEQFVKCRFPSAGQVGRAIAVNHDGDAFVAGTLSRTPMFGTNLMGADSSTPNAFVGRRATVHPTLDVRAIGTNIALQWPHTALPFALQQSTVLQSNAWSDVPTSPQELGTRRQVTLATEQPNQFFRLRMTNEIPIKHIPLVGWLSMSPSRTFLGSSPVLIAASNLTSGLSFSGYAEDDDNDSLQFEWSVDSASQPLTNGLQIQEVIHSSQFFRYYLVYLNDPTLQVGLGFHTVRLVADDRMFRATNSLTFEVISITDAVNELITATQAAVQDPDRSFLIAPLDRARTAIEEQRFVSALGELREFQVRVESSDQLPDATKSLFDNAVEQIITVIPSADS